MPSVQAPAGAKNCTIQDGSTGMPAGYTSRVEAVDTTTLVSWCGAGPLTFAVTPGRRYKFTIYVITNPPPAGTTLTVSYTWGF